MYAKKSDNELVKQIKGYIERRVQKIKSGSVQSQPTHDLADQLTKLATLNKQGDLV